MPPLRGRKIEPLRGGSEAGHDLRLKDQGCADEYGHGSWTSQPSQIANKVCRGGGVVGWVTTRMGKSTLHGLKLRGSRAIIRRLQVRVLPALAKIFHIKYRKEKEHECKPEPD